MKTVSLWARHNIRSARSLIIVSEVSLFLLAMRLGLLLLHAGIRLPAAAIVVPLFLFCISILMYYSEKARKQPRIRSYLRRRLSFFLMGLGMFSLTVFFTGSEKLLTWNAYSSLSGKETMMIKPAAFPANPLSKAGAKKAERLLRKMQKNNSLAPLYVGLIITATVLISILIASLSCTLTCNGNGALAVLVGVFGIGGVVFLCVYFCRKLLKDQLTPDAMQKRLDQQERSRQQRQQRRKLKREKETPAQADTTSTQPGKA